MVDGLGISAWTSVPAGLAIGAWAGFSATSGWIVVFPMLFVVAERPIFECLLAALVVDWANAAAASPFYLRRGDPEVRIALGWLAVSAPLLLVGVGVALVVLPRLDTVLGGAAGPIALAMGGILLRRAWRASDDEAEQREPVGSATATSRRGRVLLRTGVTLNGVLMGLLGQSGGLNAALLLIWLGGFTTRVAVATALLLVTLVLPVGIGAYLLVVGWVPELWSTLLPFAAASAGASGFAAWQSTRISERRLEFVVAACVMLAGAAATVERWAMGG